MNRFNRIADTILGGRDRKLDERFDRRHRRGAQESLDILARQERAGVPPEKIRENLIQMRSQLLELAEKKPKSMWVRGALHELNWALEILDIEASGPPSPPKPLGHQPIAQLPRLTSNEPPTPPMRGGIA